MKFAKDRKRWLQWLFEARRRYGLVILNYTETSYHIHLIVHDNETQSCIPQSMQLVAGRTGQEYNRRKKRKGAFWEDRYHATAIEDGEHLLRCMIYIDMNMVRAGVVGHPEKWPHSGYREIQKPRRKYRLIDYESLRRLSGLSDFESFQSSHEKWIFAELNKKDHIRKTRWTKSIAVGSDSFIRSVKKRMRSLAIGREIQSSEESSQLREEMIPYNALFDTGKCDMGPKNTFYWVDIDAISRS